MEVEHEGVLCNRKTDEVKRNLNRRKQSFSAKLVGPP